jgi:microcystin-dependent protein
MTTPYVGEIRLFGFSRVPDGWLPCNGSVISISQYEVLYALLGTTYGGDGQVTFGLPNLSGRIPLHWGNGTGLTPRIAGEVGGSENVTLLSGQMPTHTHTVNATTKPASSGAVGTTVELGAISGDTMYATDISGARSVALAPGAISLTGGSQPHDNSMPTLTAQYCIAWAGIFPSQG